MDANQPHTKNGTTRPVRVLFITPQPYFQWRGSPIRVSFNLMVLTELGFEVDLLCLPFGEDRRTQGVRVVRVGNLPGLKGIPIGPSIWKVPFDAKLWWAGRRLINAAPYDVVHAVEDAGALAVSLARRSGAKLIFEKHSDPVSYNRGLLRNLVMRLYSRVEAYSIRHADAVIGTGPGLVAQSRHIAPATPAYHIFDIASSLAEPEPERVAAQRRALQRNPDDVLITYVGSFAVYQGIDLLFSAIPKVAEREPRARFVIVGGTPDEIEHRRAALGPAASAVYFAGKIPPDDLPHTLTASDMLLSTRLSGTNTPLKLLDYLKAGRCIVATNSRANRLLLNEKSARFVDPDAESLAVGCCELINDPEQRQRLASGGGERIRSTYNYPEFKRRLTQVYADLGWPAARNPS